MIVPMSRIRIYGPRELQDRVAESLYQAGVLHMEQLPPAVLSLATVREQLDEERENVREKVEYETVLDKIRKVLLLLPRPERDTGTIESWFLSGQMPFEELVEVVGEIHRRAEEVFARAREVQDRGSLLQKYEKMIKALMPVLEAVPDTRHLEMIGLTIDKRNEPVLKLIEKELKRITDGDFHIFSSEIDADTLAAVLAFGRSHAPRVRELMWEKNLNELRLPAEMENLPLRDALHAVTAIAERLPAELAASRAEVDELAAHWYRFLVETKEALEGKVVQRATSTGFFHTHYSFVVAGWLPEKDRGSLRETLETTFQGQVILEDVPVTAAERELAPVHVVNHPFVRPFEVFVRLMPLPIYGTIDPTPMFAFVFPIFFGLIVGDVGYGVLSLIFAMVMSRRFARGTKLGDIFRVLTISSVYAIGFGVLFGELFGNLGEHYNIMHPMTVGGMKLDRLKEIPLFLGISVAIGILHVFLGIILGMVNSVRRRHHKHLVFKIGQFAALLSAMALIAIAANVLSPAFKWPAMIALLVGLAVITRIEGFVAPFELISAMGNILSYARLMAVGLSGVILALVANELGRASGNLVLGLLIALTIHSINLVLCIFSPTIHSMRLHLVEFFTKFYETGGSAYKPFGKHGGV